MVVRISQLLSLLPTAVGAVALEYVSAPDSIASALGILRRPSNQQIPFDYSCLVAAKSRALLGIRREQLLIQRPLTSVRDAQVDINSACCRQPIRKVSTRTHR